MSNSCLDTISATQYWLKGPIQPGQSFYLAYELDKILYVLTYVSSTTGPSLVFDPRQKSNPILITATAANPTGYIFTFTTGGNDYYIINKNNEFVATDTGSGEVLVPVNSSFDDWAMFLTGAKYIIKDTENSNSKWCRYEASGTITAGRSESITKDKVTCESIKILALPSVFYLCGSCGSNSDPTVPITIEGCWISDSFSSQPDICPQNAAESFTDLPDCQNGIWYRYCNNNTECSKGCKGQCSNGLACTYDGSIPGFKCEQPQTEKPWYQQEWFIALAVGLFILFILMLIIIFMYLG